MLRSNSANTPIIWNMALPAGVVVSKPADAGKIIPQGVQLGKEANKVVKAPPEPIHRPGHDDIEFASAASLHMRVERRALVPALGTADALVLVDLDDVAAHAAGNLS